MSKAIRVAQVVGRMESGGVEAVVMNYYRTMDKERVQFDFFVDETSSFPQREELERLGAGIYLVPPYSKPVQFHKALYKQFRAGGYRIVHTHINTMNVFPLFAAWRAKVPVRICHNHSTAHWGEGKKTLLKYLLRPFAKMFATDYFACGEQAGRWMYGDRCYEAGKVYVMKNAIDTEWFAYDPAARARLREELGLPQNAFVVGHVGRFTYAKNHDFLIDVFAELSKSWPEARLLLVGEGELKERIEQKVCEGGLADKVVFTGARKDVNKLYSVMDVFCLPSFYEGMPVVAWEAQANGLPCVVSVEVTPETILTANACRLPLKNVAQWKKDIENAKRETAELPTSFTIAHAANELKKFYCAKEKGA